MRTCEFGTMLIIIPENRKECLKLWIASLFIGTYADHYYAMPMGKSLKIKYGTGEFGKILEEFVSQRRRRLLTELP